MPCAKCDGCGYGEEEVGELYDCSKCERVLCEWCFGHPSFEVCLDCRKGNNNRHHSMGDDNVFV